MRTCVLNKDEQWLTADKRSGMIISTEFLRENYFFGNEFKSNHVFSYIKREKKWYWIMYKTMRWWDGKKNFYASDSLDRDRTVVHQGTKCLSVCLRKKELQI
jgi:hypothetical protein